MGLEHLYGATLIAALLTGDSLLELGDDATPFSVKFHASAESPVDDLVVAGRTPDGRERRVSIGVRRATVFTGRDTKTPALLKGYLSIVTDHWDEARAGRWRLVLATASRTPATGEVRELAQIARSTRNERGFRDEVGRRSQALSVRLRYVDALVRVAAEEAGKSGTGSGELTWRLLSCLRVRQLRLEGADKKDRARVVTRLRAVARDGAPEAADVLFSRLAELAGTYASSGALVTAEKLRRDLSGLLAPSGGPAPEAPPGVAIFVPGPRKAGAPRGGVPLQERWREGEEGWLGGRRYLLVAGQDGLLREAREPTGRVIWRQALARQTDPAPAAGRRYLWLRQAGRDLTRERDLLTRALPAVAKAAGLPETAFYHAVAGAVTLGLAWPADKGGLPCQTVRARFVPGTLDAWRLSLLLKGLRDLTFSLERLHRLGVSHRNLTPEAIIVTGATRFVLRDLGLAATAYRPGEGPGHYRAPEQARDARAQRPGTATDVYQVAAIAYHLITGRVPGIGAPPPRHPALPDSVTDAIGKALSVRPADRPRSSEFRAALRQPTRNGPVLARGDDPPDPPMRARSQRPRSYRARGFNRSGLAGLKGFRDPVVGCGHDHAYRR